MSPFPQSVVNSSSFHALFLDPSPRGVIQVANVLLCVFRRISSGHDGFEDEVS